jgi:hypothetical protein
VELAFVMVNEGHRGIAGDSRRFMMFFLAYAAAGCAPAPWRINGRQWRP